MPQYTDQEIEAAFVLYYTEVAPGAFQNKLTGKIIKTPSNLEVAR